VQVLEITRHPVKSLRGESLTEAELEADGLWGDRLYGILDLGTGRILTGRREPALLMASSRLTAGGLEITLPDGTVVGGEASEMDAALSGWLGRPVAIVDARDKSAGEAEAFVDPLDDSSETVTWVMPEGRYVDSFPLLVVTTASLREGAILHPSGDWSPRRFRPSLLVEVPSDGWVEDDWCGRALSVGTAEIEPVAPCVRCTMVTRPQVELGRDLEIYRSLLRHHGGTFGVGTRVRAPGVVRVGDAVKLKDA
jgi:uncharacterized protein YcbX